MEITDLKGKVITVTDIDASIAMVEDFISNRHFGNDEHLKQIEQQIVAYWTDIQNKLLALKESKGND